MKIRKISKIQIGSRLFKVIWDNKHDGGSFSYKTQQIIIGTKDCQPTELLETILHELIEIVACETHVRFYRTDIDDDYIFNYDHRQHSTMTSTLAGLLAQFIG